jgi:hypothetical protein
MIRTLATSLTLSMVLAAAPAAAAGTIDLSLDDPSRPAQVHVTVANGSVSVTGSSNGDRVRVHSKPTGVRADGSPATGGGPRPLEIDRRGNEIWISTRPEAEVVDLEIEVPRASDLVVSATNPGRVRVAGVQGRLEIEHVNGPIELDRISGAVTANTVNGDIHVDLETLGAGTPLAFSTLNGDIELTAPADLKADVHLLSTHGRVESGFRLLPGPDTAVSEAELRGAISGGGAEIYARTFNGDVRLRARPAR